MIKVTDTITERLYDMFDNYYIDLFKRLMVKSVWFDIHYTNYKLIFIRRYSVYDANKFSIESWHEYINNFINDMKFTDDEYVDVEIFGNGISFTLFTDIYKIMEE